MEQHEQQYKDGFNDGYLLARYEPDLYSTVTKGLDAINDYVDGVLSGGKEYDHEKNIPAKSHSKEVKDRDIEKDR